MFAALVVADRHANRFVGAVCAGGHRINGGLVGVAALGQGVLVEVLEGLVITDNGRI